MILNLIKLIIRQFLGLRAECSERVVNIEEKVTLSMPSVNKINSFFISILINSFYLILPRFAAQSSLYFYGKFR